MEKNATTQGDKRPWPDETEHKQVPISWGNKSALVDEGIAPLILELWKADLVTINSCEDPRPGIMWVQFLTAEDAATFLNIVAEYEDDVDSQYNRINPRWRPLDGELSAPEWEYDAWPDDGGIDEGEDEAGECQESHPPRPNDFSFILSIRFPRTDLPVVLERLIQHNRTRRRAPG
jgi:hypothetical protein